MSKSSLLNLFLGGILLFAPLAARAPFGKKFNELLHLVSKMKHGTEKQITNNNEQQHQALPGETTGASYASLTRSLKKKGGHSAFHQQLQYETEQVKALEAEADELRRRAHELKEIRDFYKKQKQKEEAALGDDKEMATTTVEPFVAVLLWTAVIAAWAMALASLMRNRKDARYRKIAV